MNSIQLYNLLKKNGTFADDPSTEEKLRKMCKFENNQKSLVRQRVFDLASQKKWEEFCTELLVHDEIIEEALNHYYDEIPENFRRELVLGSYVNNGWKLQAVREAVKKLSCNGLNELPDEYAGKEKITIYRAGYESIDKVNEGLSWSLDEEKAIYFLERKYYFHQNVHLYQACIFPKNVISYQDETEKEVIQYRKIFDVKEINDPSLWHRVKDDIKGWQ